VQINLEADTLPSQ